MLAVSFNLIFGYTGQLSMFHAAAFGISVPMPLSYRWPISQFLFGSACFHRGLYCFVQFHLCVGTVCFRFRLKEFYFAIVTLACSGRSCARLIILNWSSFTNGSLGINLTETPTLWLPEPRRRAGRGHAHVVLPRADRTHYHGLYLYPRRAFRGWAAALRRFD